MSQSHPNLTIDKSTGVYYTQGPNGIYKSTDQGQTWSKLSMSEYQRAIDCVTEYCSKEVPINFSSRSIPPSREGSWNDLFLAGLYRYGLMLTQSQAYALMGDQRYPNGVPIIAPRPTNDDPKLWPPDTWIIYRD